MRGGGCDYVQVWGMKGLGILNPAPCPPPHTSHLDLECPALAHDDERVVLAAVPPEPEPSHRGGHGVCPGEMLVVVHAYLAWKCGGMGFRKVEGQCMDFVDQQGKIWETTFSRTGDLGSGGAGRQREGGGKAHVEEWSPTVCRQPLSTFPHSPVP